MKLIKIYDADGVLINSAHRYKEENGKIDIAHWQNNRHLAYADELLPMAEQYQRELQAPDHIVIIATARQLHAAEIKHLKNILGWPHYMISRKYGDHRPAYQQKISGLRSLFNLKQFAVDCIKFYYDDNHDVCYKVAAAIDAIPIHIKSKQGGHT